MMFGKDVLSEARSEIYFGHLHLQFSFHTARLCSDTKLYFVEAAALGFDNALKSALMTACVL